MTWLPMLGRKNSDSIRLARAVVPDDGESREQGEGDRRRHEGARRSGGTRSSSSRTIGTAAETMTTPGTAASDASRTLSLYQ